MTTDVPEPAERRSGWARTKGLFWMSIGLVVLLYGPIAFVSGLVGAEALTEADGGTAGLLIYLGAISAFMFVFVSRLVAKAPEHETIATGLFFAFTGVSATMYLLAGSAQFVAVLANHGQTVSLNPSQSSLDMNDIYGKLLHEALDVIPLLDISATLGWEDPIADPAASFGWILVIVKLILITVIVSTAYQLVRAAPKLHWRRPRSSPPAEPAETPPATTTAPAG